MAGEKFYGIFLGMKKHTLYQTYAFPGFTPRKNLLGLDGDTDARIVVLKRYQKKQSVRSVDAGIELFTTARPNGYVTCPVETCTFTCKWKCVG